MIHLESERTIKIHGREITVFNDGSVRVHGRNTKRRFGDISYKGYRRISLWDADKVQHTVFVHRLVAMAFIPNPDGKPQINHKNGIKTDNRVENLEWCTALENSKHKSDVLEHYGRRTPVRCVETGKAYGTTSEAASLCGVSRANICSCIIGKRKTAGGFHWERV